MSRHVTKQRVWTIVLIWVSLVYLPRLACVIFGADMVYDKLIGQTELQVMWGYGEAYREYPGYSGVGGQVPDPSWTLPETAIRTVIYHPRGLFHPERGTLYVWYCQTEDGWVCFGSTWFSDFIQI
ncbi:MAG: hypothetical protein K8U57_00680 [Planctomycetes bacterium]|nr:hypothetical protein [Planctomycetota bacterium]